MRSIVLLSFGVVAYGLPHRDASQNSSKLDWGTCDLNFPKSTSDKIQGVIECATLEVPLDYTDPGCGKTLRLQLVKRPATKEAKGNIIFNPGGPGRSGVLECAEEGHKYRDDLFDGQYNIICFDARGTGRTIPYACDLTKGSNTTSNFTSNAHSQPNNNTALPSGDMFKFLTDKAWSDGERLASACANTEGIPEIAPYIGTTFVARDLLRIVDSVEEDGLLRFWGRSYSTVLGQTFAAMFPDRIGRMLLDSNLRASDYFDGSWLTATSGTEVSLRNWLKNCIDAGESCAGVSDFHGPNTTVDSLMDALADGLRDAQEKNLFYPETYQPQYWYRPGSIPVLLEVKYNMFVNLYGPALSQVTGEWALILTVLNRNWTALFEATSDAAVTEELPWQLGTHNLHGIGCADSTFRAKSPDEMYSLVQAQSKQGSFAESFSPQLWPCTQWPHKSVEQPKGQFKDIRTSYPILFVNGAYDPITPLNTAWQIAAGFKGSRLLTHKGHGHGFFNHPSNCTINAVREYFFNGVLPEQGTECEPNLSIFEYASSQIASQGNGTTGGVEGGLSKKALLKFPHF